MNEACFASCRVALGRMSVMDRPGEQRTGRRTSTPPTDGPPVLIGTRAAVNNLLFTVFIYASCDSCCMFSQARRRPLHLLSGSARLLFPGTMGKDKSWLSWLLTEEINHSAHQRIAFQSASWELHYPAPATHYHADCHWLGLRGGVRSPTSVTAGGVSDQSRRGGEEVRRGGERT